MTVISELENLQIEKSKKASDYQNASERFDLLIERGLTSKRKPTEIGRSNLVCKTYTYCNFKELRK